MRVYGFILICLALLGLSVSLFISANGYMSIRRIFVNAVSIIESKLIFFYYIFLAIFMSFGLLLVSHPLYILSNYIVEFFSACLTLLIAVLAILFFKRNFKPNDNVQSVLDECIKLITSGSVLCVIGIFLAVLYDLTFNISSSIVHAGILLVIYFTFIIVLEVLLISIKRLSKLALHTN